jgi:hypothetical protein
LRESGRRARDNERGDNRHKGNTHPHVVPQMQPPSQEPERIE